MSRVPGRPFPLRPGVDLTGLHATVMGLGYFSGGVSTVRWLVDHGADVLVTDQKGSEELSASLAALDGMPVRFRLGGHEEADFTSAGLVVVSPAVPPDSRYLAAAAAAGVPLMTELSLTMGLLRGPVAWVTGTCGKSTTTALIGEILARSGVPARVGGNIGRALLAEVETFAPEEITVLEVSSFQLEWMERDGVRPDLAVLTNVTPNHLDRHGDFESYLRLKAAALPDRGPAILNREDEATRHHVVARARSRIYYASLAGEVDEGVFLRGDRVIVREAGREEDVLGVSDIRLLGSFNRMNVLQAVLAARLLGAGTEDGAEAVRGFRGLSHRLEDVGEQEGVRGVNDSKATTPEAASRALTALEGPIVLIAGGFERGADLAGFAAAIRGRATAVILLGEAAERLAAMIGEDGPERVFARDMAEAVKAGLSRCRPGDTLLLSPGHASWDQFENYEERGELFRGAFLSPGAS